MDVAEVDVEFAADEFGELLLREFHLPTVEIGRLLIEVVEHLRENLFIRRVTPGVVDADEVGLGRVFPAILELLSLATTALVETGVADLVAIGQYLSAGFEDSLFDMGTGGLGDALITLAVVVGTDIEDGVILTIVPADEFIILSREREEAIGTLLMFLALGHLGKEPRTRDDRMGLEELG